MARWRHNSLMFICAVYNKMISKLFGVTPQLFFIYLKYSHLFFILSGRQCQRKRLVCYWLIAHARIYFTSSLQARHEVVDGSLSRKFQKKKNNDDKRNSIFLGFSFLETNQPRFMWVMHIQWTVDLERADSFCAYRGYNLIKFSVKVS